MIYRTSDCSLAQINGSAHSDRGACWCFVDLLLLTEIELHWICCLRGLVAERAPV